MVHMVHNFVLCSTFLHPCANQLQCWLLDPFWPLHGFLATHYICLGDRSGWHCNFGTLYSTSIIVHSARCARAALWTISAHPPVACKPAPCCHHWVLDAKLRRGKKLGSILFQSVGAWEKMRKPGIYSLQATLGVLSLEDARSYCTWCCSWQSISSTWCCTLSLSLSVASPTKVLWAKPNMLHKPEFESSQQEKLIRDFASKSTCKIVFCSLSGISV